MSHNNLQSLRVFIASPSDLNEERRIIKELVDRLNVTFGRRNLHIQLLGWEDTLPGAGRPQDRINDDVDKADLFIGFLSRRWGSASGHQEYTSGFEEEFYRAFKRKEATGNPEICVFFKCVESSAMVDPGEHLKKILEFKKDLVQNKKLLFREFKDKTDWERQIYDLLASHLLTVLTSTELSPSQSQPQQPAAQPPNSDAVVVNDQKKTMEVARQEVMDVWNEVGTAIKKGELSVYGRLSETIDALKVARLGLAVASIVNRDVESGLLGVHLINLLYKNRKRIKLNRIEEMLVLRTIIGSTFELTPGWFWLKDSPVALRGLLQWLAYSDTDSQVRVASIHLAQSLDWRLGGKPGKLTRTIKKICLHDDPTTRRAGLEYLAAKGAVDDLPYAQMLVKDPDNGVRTQADQTIREILLRHDAASYFKSFVLPLPYVSNDTISSVWPHSIKLDSIDLKTALRHANDGVRILGAKVLAERGAISAEGIRELGLTNPAAVWQAYYVQRVKSGAKCDPAEVRREMVSDVLSFGLLSQRSADPDKVIEAIFHNLSYDELLSYLDFRTDDGVIAYRVLAKIHFDKFVGKIKADLSDNFLSLERASKHEPRRLLSSFLFEPNVYTETSNRPVFLAEALNALAANAKSTDRGMFFQFIDNDSTEVRMAAIRGLQRSGVLADVKHLLTIAERAANEEEAVEAARASIALSPNEGGAAAQLLQSRRPYLVKLAIKSLTQCSAPDVWKLICARLYDEDELIRKPICAYAISRFPAKSLERILDDYLARDTYFYDVVFYLDRATYAKAPLRKILRDEIVAFLA